ncbi:terminase small subunit [Reyranella sp.]|uniref:terminase small subunit n=1 Tax=Reyranella sp. TaxID=1929291 RepID=UPI0040365C79
MKSNTKPRSGLNERRQAFVQAYLSNGHNATQAAISAGYSPKTAQEQGSRLLSNVMVRAMLATKAEEVAAVVELETARTLRHVACVSYSDIGQMLDEQGKLIPIPKMAPEVRAAIKSIEFDKDTGGVTKIGLWDKNAGLEKAMKHHGLYERDNDQRREDLSLQIVLVGASTGAIERGVLDSEGARQPPRQDGRAPH